MVAKSIAFSQAAQSVALAASSETQIPISCGVASLTMTADPSWVHAQWDISKARWGQAYFFARCG